MNGIKLRGAGSALPAAVLTNSDLAGMVETSDEWIVSRTGIHERHLCRGESLLSLISAAAREALERAGVSPEDIGVCLVATATPDTVVPAAACMLQRELGLATNTLCFDLSAACSGFLFALHTAECLLNASPKKFGLVVGAESLSRAVDWTDRNTCVLFGDGAGAAVVEVREGWPTLGAELGCAGNSELLRLPGMGTGEPQTLSMEGSKVFKFAVASAPWCCRQVLARTGRTLEDIDYFVFHQANGRILDAVIRRLGIPPEKCRQNVGAYGNTSAASIPIAISELQREGKLRPGTRLMLVGFGGGLTWGGALLEFGEN